MAVRATIGVMLAMTMAMLAACGGGDEFSSSSDGTGGDGGGAEDANGEGSAGSAGAPLDASTADVVQDAPHDAVEEKPTGCTSYTCPSSECGQCCAATQRTPQCWGGGTCGCF